MKVIIFGHENIGFRISNQLYLAYKNAIEKAKPYYEDLDEIDAIKEQIRVQGKAFDVDFIATGDE